MDARDEDLGTLPPPESIPPVDSCDAIFNAKAGWAAKKTARQLRAHETIGLLRSQADSAYLQRLQQGWHAYQQRPEQPLATWRGEKPAREVVLHEASLPRWNVSTVTCCLTRMDCILKSSMAAFETRLLRHMSLGGHATGSRQSL